MRLSGGLAHDKVDSRYASAFMALKDRMEMFDELGLGAINEIIGKAFTAG